MVHVAGPHPVTSHPCRIRFDLEAGEYLYLHRQDASLPQQHFAMASDHARLLAYQGAVERAVQQLKGQGQPVLALDLGCGSGSLALILARAGAESVVAVDAHPALCDIARTNAALNGLSSKVRYGIKHSRGGARVQSTARLLHLDAAPCPVTVCSGQRCTRGCSRVAAGAPPQHCRCKLGSV